MRAVALGASVAVCGGAVGVAVAAGSDATRFALVACGAALLAVLVMRRGLQLTAGRGRTAQADQVENEPRERLTVARLFFFAGALTVAFATWRPFGGLTVSAMLFLVAFAAVILEVLRGRRVAPVPLLVIVGALTFAFGGLISSASAVNEMASYGETLNGVYVTLLWAWTGAMVLRTPRDFRIAVTLWTISVAICGLGALAQLVDIDFLVAPIANGRMTGFTDHPNDLGGAAAIALVPALALASVAFQRSGPSGGMVALVMPLLIAAALVISGSVAAMASALVAILIWLASPVVRSSTRLATVAVIVIALVTATVIGGSVSPTQRLTQVSSTQVEGGGSGDARLEIARAVWPAIEADPVVGAGLDNASAAVEIVVVGGALGVYRTHGMPLAAWYEGGIFALLGLLLICAGLVRAMAATRDTRDPSDELIGWSLCAAMCAAFLYLLSAPLFFQQYAWIAAVMLVAWRAREPEVATDAGWDAPRMASYGTLAPHA